MQSLKNQNIIQAMEEEKSQEKSILEFLNYENSLNLQVQKFTLEDQKHILKKSERLFKIDYMIPIVLFFSQNLKTSFLEPREINTGREVVYIQNLGLFRLF